MALSRHYSDLTIYRRLWRQARAFWPHIGGLFLLSLVSMPVTLLTPVPLKLVVDCVLGTRELPAALTAVLPEGTHRSDLAVIAFIAGLLVGIAVIKQLADLAFSGLRTFAGEKLVLSFRADLFRHVQRLSLSYHDTQDASDSTYPIHYDTTSIQ